LAVLACACFAVQLQALSQTRGLGQYMKEKWGIERGFPGGTVVAIAQTRDGYLWIGTDKGLSRFDGLTFRSFPQATPMPMPIGAVRALETDSDGNLWILLQNTKILRYHEGKFDSGRDEAEVGITAMDIRSDGRPIFFSIAYGLLTYGEGKFTVTQPSNRASEDSTAATTSDSTDTLSSRLSWATGVAMHRLAAPDAAVIAIAETSDGKVWMGTGEKGLFSLVDGRISAAAQSRLVSKITCLLPMESGKLWIATESGVVAWNGKELTQNGIPSELRGIKIFSMFRDRDSNVWLGTSRGLLRYNVDGVASSGGQASGSSSQITAMFEDREGNLWTGSPVGIERIRDGAFVSYSVSGMESESSGPIYVDEEGRAWFAPFGGGLHWLKDGATGTVKNDGLNEDVVYSITGSHHELWVGRQKGGLTHVTYSGGAIVTKTYTQKDGLPQNGVYAVYLSRDGSLWASTISSGVGRYVNGRFETYRKASGMVSDTVVSMTETADGTMWFATSSGLNALSNGQWRTFTVSQGLPSDTVYSLLSDADGTVWIGTANGLAFARSGRIAPLPEGPAALKDAVLGMAEGRDGRLWIATSRNVLAVRKDKLLNGTLTAEDLRAFGLEDGLLGTEGVKRERSVFADHSGRIWFSMNRGLSVVDTARKVDSLSPAVVRLEQISVDGNLSEVKPAIRVPAGSHRVTFAYSGLSLSVPERVRFKYKLDNFDKGWSDPVTGREAVYTNLDSGKYRFRVMASNSDGVWNGAESSVAIEIAPVFWSTWWFRVCVVLLIGIMLTTYFRLRMHRMEQQMNIRFEERLAERARIARELHDSLLQGFQGLMFRLQAAREMLPERPGDAAEALDVALDRGDQAIAEGRNTVEDLRESTLRTSDIVQSLTTLGEELNRSNNGHGPTTLRVLVEGKPRELDPVLRDEIYRIGREALRNAFQHAHARNIEAEVTYGEEQFSLRVRDDGDGIDPGVFQEGKRAGHWGLPGMRERADGFGGQLHIWTESRAGTEIEVTVPAATAYGDSLVRSGLGFLRAHVRGTHGRRS
jgi:signal transduction histidine kinase/ligand-binding sensor domain-containing protein